MVGDDWNAARTDLAHEGKVATLKLLFCQIAVLPGNGRMRFDACCIRNDNGAVDQNPDFRGGGANGPDCRSSNEL